MEDHASLGQYLFGAGLLLVCLLAALSLSWLERRRRSWSRSIIVHAVQLSFMFCALGVARHYVRMAIVDYQLNWISPALWMWSRSSSLWGCSCTSCPC